MKETAGTGPDEGQIEALEAAFLAAYLDTQYHYVQFLTEHLADCAAAFGGDLDAVLIIAVLGQRRLEAARQDPGQASPDPARIAMNAARISDVSTIPRETVRRKLESMRRKGWVEKHPRAGWYIAGRTSETPARDALSDLEARSFRRLARLHKRLSEILDREAPRDAP